MKERRVYKQAVSTMKSEESTVACFFNKKSGCTIPGQGNLLSSDVQRNMVSCLVNDKGALTAWMVVKLAALLGYIAEFWLNIQYAVELWNTEMVLIKERLCAMEITKVGIREFRAKLSE